MPKLSVLKSSLRFRLSFMAAVLVFGSVPLVGPYGWSIGAQGDCHNAQPKGASWLNWYGYNLWSWGESRHNLQLYNPTTNNWDTYAFASGGVKYGITNSSVANTTTGFRTGLWIAISRNSANFTTVNPSASQLFTC